MTDEKNPGAWVITDVWSKAGVRITVKSSGIDTVTAIEDLYAGIAHGMSEHGWQTETPSAPEAPKTSVNVPVDESGRTQIVSLPEGDKLYTVKELFRTKSKDGSRDLLKIVTVEPPYNTKFGVTAFDAPIQDWKSWPLDTRYAPPEGAKHVIISDPSGNSKYPNVKDLR